MKKLGIKGKINLGFAVLFLLLLCSGVISIYELMRVRQSVSGLLASNINNLALSRKTLDAARHISYAMQAQVAGNDSSARAELAVSDSLLTDIQQQDSKGLVMMDSRSEALKSLDILLLNLREDVSSAFAMRADERHALYFNNFLPAYRILMQQLYDLMELNQNALGENAKVVEQNRYRIVMPCIISVFAGLVLILLFSYFIVHFFVNPLIKITRAIENTVEFKAPFKPNVEAGDEIGELKEAITHLSLQAKKSTKE